VVEKMKEHQCVIGGEGNGGVIYPTLHYGRDALVGIALFLSHLAGSGCTCSQLRKKYPDYVISKNRVELPEGTDADRLLERFAEAFAGHEVNREDGVKVEMEAGWIHLRKSNTEPLIRLYAEAGTAREAEALAGMAKETIHGLLKDE